MKKVVLSQMLFIFFVSCIFAQSGDIVRIKAGENPAAGFSPHGFYRFPTFSEGVVVFKNGGKTSGRFNYHLLNEEVQFISANGDTLALSDPLAIQYITIDSSLFYYSEGYLEVVESNESLKLAKKLRLNTNWEKIGAYGQASPSGSIRTANRIMLGNTGSNLRLNEDLVIEKKTTYYWLDKYNTVLKATKANLLKLLPSDKERNIEEYVKNNKIDFKKEADLKKLLKYSSSAE